MKRKKTDYTKKPWTPWVELPIPPSDLYVGDAEPPAARYANSRYDVSIWFDGSDDHPMGKWVHLSIKDHGRSTRHDWRDFQRIKNELVGPEYEGVELYPAESRLVDTANQYHIYVFQTWRAPFGFRDRLVAEGKSKHMPKAEQRPFDVRPADCLQGDAFDAMVEAAIAKGKGIEP